MAVLKVDCKYQSDEFKGIVRTERNSELKIGRGEGEVYPYDMLLGALASCYYATFRAVAEKKKLKYREASIEVKGEKREEKPTTLKYVNLDLVIYGAEDKKGFERTAQLAAEYCSIYQTIAKVADMEFNLDFLD